jgi:hypothetical protein
VLSRTDCLKWTFEDEPDSTAVDRLVADPDGAASLLRQYFGPVTWDGTVGFTGSWFERFDGGGDRHAVADRFTPADLVAVSMLSVDIPARAGWLLVTDPGGRLSRRLAQIPTDLALADVETAEGLVECRQLWDEVGAMAGIARTKTSKLLARKRPHLIPVQDTVTMSALAEPNVFWEPLRQKLRSGLHQRLLDVATGAGTPAVVSVLRVLDILLWMQYR